VVEDPRRTARDTPPAELEALAAVTPEDVERAKIAAERDGSALLAAMLNALPDENM
jgi:hypothetical protein